MGSQAWHAASGGTLHCMSQIHYHLSHVSLCRELAMLKPRHHAHVVGCAQGASDDILNAKNTLYQHLTWCPEKAVSLCSKLALPLATPAVGVTPPVSPKSTSGEGEQGRLQLGQAL